MAGSSFLPVSRLGFVTRKVYTAFPVFPHPRSYLAELGADHFDRLDPQRLTRHLVRRLERLGHKVTLEPIAA
jgi:hypothetical protein